MADNYLILVVSLKRSHERRSSFSKAMADQQLNFSFVDAIDAQEGFAEYENIIDQEGRRILSDGELACALSHRKAVKTFIDSNHSHAVILEDDAIPSPVFRNIIEEETYKKLDMLLYFHSYSHVYMKKPIAVHDKATAYPLALNCSSATAYSLNRSAATKLYSNMTPIKGVADWPMNIWELNAHVTHPCVIGHPDREIVETTIVGSRAVERKKVDRLRFLKIGHIHKRIRKLGSTRIS